MRKLAPYVLPALLLLATAALVIHPNPFGNQPNAVFDESLFVTSALASLAKPTLPGWDFTPGGAYYGGQLTYLVTVLIAVVAAGATVAFRSAALAQSWMLLHTGDLMALTRAANGILLLAAAAALAWTAERLKRAAPDARRDLYLFAGLLFASSMFSTFMITGRVWTLQLLYEIAAACAVFRFEARKRAGTAPDARRHALLLTWLAFLAFLQNISGASTGLWIAYALFLRHIAWQDVFAALKRSWWPMLLLLALHVSFFAKFVGLMFDGADLSGAATMYFRQPDGSTDWAMQFRWPIGLIRTTHPLVLPLLAAALMLYALRHRELGRTRWAAVMLAHPLLTLLFYFGLFRFGAMVHYVLPLAIALSATVAFLPKGPRVRLALLAVAWIAAAAVVGKTARLHWKPSTERQVVAFFEGARNRADALIVVDEWRLLFPFNVRTLEALEGPLASTKRIALLKERPADVEKLSSFKPVAWYGAPEGESYARLEGAASSVWQVSMGCARRCSAREIAAGTCVGFGDAACDAGLTYLPDGESWRGLFSTERMGYTYHVRQLR